MQPYVLASQSPRRRELLAWLDLPFHAIAADVDETPLAGEPPAALAVRLAGMKARAAAQTTPTAPVLSADTVVDLEGVSLGKPADAAEAWAMLTALRGREHAVHTGVALWDARTGALRLDWGVLLLVIFTLLQIAFGNIPETFTFRKSMLSLGLAALILGGIVVLSIYLVPHLLMLGR